METVLERKVSTGDVEMIHIMNGWGLAPQCWRTHMLNPFHYRKIESKNGHVLWREIKIFGFVIFFYDD